MTDASASPTSQARFCQVALPLPLHSAYTYLVPDALAGRVAPGARVVVPVRRRELVGIVVDADAPAPPVAAKPLLAAPDDVPALPEALLETARWMAGYYGAPLGLTLKCILPAGMWGSSQVVMTLRDGAPAAAGVAAEVVRWLAGKGGEGSVASAQRALKRPLWDAVQRLAQQEIVTLRVEAPDTAADGLTERVVALAAERLTLLGRQEAFKRRPRQLELYETLESLGGSASLRHLKERLKYSDGVVKALVDAGHARLTDAERLRDPFADSPASPPPGTLTPDQRVALAEIDSLGPGEGALLFGVTGSGKTLVYLEAVREALQAGKSAVVLVPEIGLTPQTVSRLRGMFGDEVAVLHSGLSDGERADAWRMLRRGERRVAVGARSAVFAPLSDVGIIVVDEEHEASYKNGETPRYHTRDVAAVRARLEGARLVLGSATPSLESWVRVGIGPGKGLRLVSLPERVGARPMPPVELVDLRQVPLVKEAQPLAWSAPLDAAIVQTLARGEQVLLLLNRRGFAAYLQCPDCGEVRTCPHCSISLTVHHTPPGLRCHYCDHQAPLPYTCDKCANPVQEMRGVGTQQLEQMLSQRYPQARIARMDLDTTSTKWSHQRILGAVERGEVDLLLGTQMIAKGLDFPNVTLVGVVDADTGLHLPDFRSAERSFQLLAQVAGRAGRGPKGGRVLVQTRSPEHHALVRAAQHDTEGFLREELGGRDFPPYPPTTSLVNILVSGPDERGVGREAAGVADWVNALVTKHKLPIMVLGPAPCPLARIKDRWRWHLLLKGPAAALGRLVRYAARRIDQRPGVRVVLDRDPVSLL